MLELFEAGIVYRNLVNILKVYYIFQLYRGG